MGIQKIKICNFKTINTMELDLNEGGVSCLLGKNGVGKTTIINAIRYFYKIAEQPYEVEQVIDKKNPYIQKTIVELKLSFKNLFKRTSNLYIEETLNDFDKYIKDGVLPIRMTQYKNGVVEWYPINNVYKVRKLLRLFPMYIVDTRSISLYEWSELWEVICDIAISRIEQDSKNVKNILTEVFAKIYGEKYTKVYEIVENIFQAENITINERDYKKRFKNAIIANFGGDIFKFNEQGIGYYSAGMNSLKYITLFLKLIMELSNTAWKDIMIIFDEPEISLHPQYIEKLADIISEYGDKNSIIISTHSTHFVSSLIRNELKIDFFEISNIDGYAQIKRIKDYFEQRDKYLIGDEEAASYFADLIVFVEGQTEIQLLKNRKIVELYPFLKRVTIYNTKSNDSITKLIIPKGDTAIPFVNIIDLDKILSYSNEKNVFKIENRNSVVNPLGNKENLEQEKFLFYGMRKKRTYGQRKRIEEMLKNKFITNSNSIFIEGQEYRSLVLAIKRYCKWYNCLPFRTTVEGAIICEASLDVIIEWISTLSDRHKELIEQLEVFDRLEKEVILRCILHGKLDNLVRLNKNKAKGGWQKANTIIQKYTSGEKVDGWVLNFYTWFFEHYMIKSEEENRKIFARTFPEINEVLQFIKYMLKSKCNE